jgi:hypothetical protein
MYVKRGCAEDPAILVTTNVWGFTYNVYDLQKNKPKTRG